MQLFCGHKIEDKLYNQMFSVRNVRCPKCGLEWRGTMVIARDKKLPKQELRWAEQQQANREKSRNRK